MTASPAADWLPVVNGLQPDLPKGTLLHVRFKDGTSSEDGNPERAEDWYWKRYGGPAEIVAYCLAPAQPAEGQRYREAAWLAQNDLDWHPTSLLPAEGRVVELRMRGDSYFDRHMHKGGKFSYACDFADFNACINDCIYQFEWRYPPGERAEATINAAGQVEEKQAHRDANEPVPATPQRQNLGLWLALRGRAPWPVERRDTLPALPITSWRIWK